MEEKELTYEEMVENCTCDCCNTTFNEKDPIDTYTITLEGTGKSFTLCEKCLKELDEIIRDFIE